MEMKNRLLFVPVLVALVVSLSACGGGSQNIPAGAIAVVNGTPITTAQYNDFFAQGLAAAKLQGQTVTPGSTGFTAVHNQTVAELVELAEVKQQMKKEGITVTPGDIDKFLKNLVQTTYHGSQAKFQVALKTSHLSMKQAREQVFINLLATKMHTKVTSSAKSTPADENAYYKANLAQFAVVASTTRHIAHILVKTKALANTIEQKLQNGANFAALAKQYSTDTGSAANGGELCMSKSGQVTDPNPINPATPDTCQTMVAPFAKVAWALKTGKISAPVHSQYGWHVIKAVGPVDVQKAHTETFKQAQAVIHQAVLKQAQDTLWQQWLTDLQNEYKGKVSYGSGFAPPTTTALPTTTG
jgi:foldase protein PrsA